MTFKHMDLEELYRKMAEVRAAVGYFTDEVNAALAAKDGSVRGGQHVSFHGEFASVPLSGLLSLKRHADRMHADLVGPEVGR